MSALELIHIFQNRIKIINFLIKHFFNYERLFHYFLPYLFKTLCMFKKNLFLLCQFDPVFNYRKSKYHLIVLLARLYLLVNKHFLLNLHFYSSLLTDNFFYIKQIKMTIASLKINSKFYYDNEISH